MECACSVSIDHDGDGPSCYTKKMVTARKQHKCGECRRVISEGEQYESISGIWDGEPARYKTCMDCKSIKDVFFESYTFETVLDDFYESFDPDSIPEKCIARLTPNARERVCRFIENSWEDEEQE